MDGSADADDDGLKNDRSRSGVSHGGHGAVASARSGGIAVKNAHAPGWAWRVSVGPVALQRWPLTSRGKSALAACVWQVLARSVACAIVAFRGSLLDGWPRIDIVASRRGVSRMKFAWMGISASSLVGWVPWRACLSFLARY